MCMWDTKVFGRWVSQMTIGLGLLSLATACSDRELGVYDSKPHAESETAEPSEIELDRLEQRLTSQEWPSDPLVLTNSVHFEQRGTFQGALAVTRAAGAVFANGAELSLDLHSSITGPVRADTIYVGTSATISGTATYNNKLGPGSLPASPTALSLPLPLAIPQLPTFTAGSTAVNLGINEVRTLSSGSYGAVTLAQSNAGGTTTLSLLGGTYAFASIAMGIATRIECQSECEVRVFGRVSALERAYFGPAAVSGMGPGNVRLLVRGGNVGGTPASTPAACSFGNDVNLGAWTLVPNGTLRLGQRVRMRGKVVARDAVIGMDSVARGLELPAIVQGPTDSEVWEHQSSTFTVTATGVGVTYQWQRNGADIPGATGTSFTVANVGLSDDGAQFRVVLTNEAGSVATAAAVLEVIPVPVPKVICVVPSMQLSNGEFAPGRVVFGYDNPAGRATTIPAGPRNHVEVSDGTSVTPVSTFSSSSSTAAFVAPLANGGHATWTLEGVSAEADEADQHCELPDIVPPAGGRTGRGEAPGDYDPSLPKLEHYVFDGLQAYYTSGLEIPPGWRQQLGALELQQLPLPPGAPVVLPVRLVQSYTFENFSWIDDGAQRDHLRVVVSVNGEERGVADCERHEHCTSELDLGLVTPGVFDPQQPQLAGLALSVQFRRCPFGQECEWRTIGFVNATVTLDLGRTLEPATSDVYCQDNDCDFFIGTADIGLTRVRFEDYDGFNDVFNIDFGNNVTPPSPPPPSPPTVPGTAEGLCVHWNTSFVEDLLYLDAPPEYPAAFAEFSLVVKNASGDTLTLGNSPTSPQAPAFLNEHGCIPFLDPAGQPTPAFNALVTPVGAPLPELELRVATRFQKPAGVGTTTFDVHRLNSYVSIQDADVVEALGAWTEAGDVSNLVLIFRTDAEMGALDPAEFREQSGFLLPPSPWVFGRERNTTLHPMTNAAAVVSQLLRTAGPTQFAAGAAHEVEVGAGCPGGTDQVDTAITQPCTSDADCGDPLLPRCLQDTRIPNGGKFCSCNQHSQCSDGRTCALGFIGAVLGQCAINQGDSCAVTEPKTLAQKLFIGPPTMSLNKLSCSSSTPCPGHQLCLSRTPGRRYPDDPNADPDAALFYGDLNPLAVRLDPCAENATNCFCHDPDQGRWKFVVAHEAGHHVQLVAGASLGSATYMFQCPPNSSSQTCPALGEQERNADGSLYDLPFIEPKCGCSHVTEANKWHCLQSLERASDSVTEGFAQFFASSVFNDANAVASPDVDPCTFVYYKSYKDAEGAVHPAPFPVSCSASDRWRNNHCPVDGDFSTEQDWMQFLWAWHTTVLNNDIGEMYSIFKATCQCTIDPATGVFECAAPPGCTFNATSGAMECDATNNCQPGSPTCDIPDCTSNAAFWDWPSEDLRTDQTGSLREGVIWRYSGGLNSTQVNPGNFPEYTQFFNLSRTRGVNLEMDLK